MSEGDAGVEARGLHLVGQVDTDEGGTMGLALRDGYVYVGHTGKGSIATSVIDVRNPARPRVVGRLTRDEGTHSHKAVVVGDVLLQNCERDQIWEGPPFVAPVGGAERWNPGLRILSLAEPEAPREIAFWSTPGDGVHRMTYADPPYAYLTASDDGYTDQFLVILDLSDPAAPKEVGRWWYPGMWVGGGERPRFPKDRRYALHHALRSGDLLFCGWWDAGLVILDVADPSRPQFVANLNWGSAESGATHTALPLPGRDLVVVTDEAIVPDCKDIPKQVRVVDVADPYSPRVVSTLPVPQGNFCSRGGRFGPHNLREQRPQVAFSATQVLVTYFNAGLRVFDLEDPADPREVAFYVPDARPGQKASQTDDVTVGVDGLIYLTDREAGGLTVLAFDEEGS